MFTILLFLKLGLRYPWKRVDNNRKRGRWNRGLRHLFILVFGFQENFMKNLSAFILFFWWQRKEWFLKALFSAIPWLLNSPNLLNYGSESGKIYTLRLLLMCLEERKFRKLFFLRGEQRTYLGKERVCLGGLVVGETVRINYKRNFIQNSFQRFS